MAEALAYTPYDGSRRPFSIGLKPLDLGRWIEPDGHLVRHLREKERLLAERPEVVFAAEDGTEAAQAETLDLLAGHLETCFPDLYGRDGKSLTVPSAGVRVALGDDDEPALMRAARLVQEDLVLMRAGDGGYRLAAAALCFPSAWSLREKFGQTLDGVHEHVPGYKERLGVRMNRIFETLKVDMPTWRINWSLYADDQLHHPESKSRPRDWFSAGDGSDAFVRVERQTLRRLPRSGDILFTIKIYVDPVAAFRSHPDGAALAEGLRRDILALDEGELRYKALIQDRDRIAGMLERLAHELRQAGPVQEAVSNPI
ncbi:heme-dependent oxidative N-demethylase family protein [Lutibaculum baratangense]|uniref:DUF3445 domain-containing protein n=1 Tax=Lutibaculum baratangense AMV1 TaxID=631454 RepID=V4QTM4_9HYPH|nr:DUF3445 domain-containing protein [Lutibaculum baratangense]ESR23112.1 hypothetical protein N177_3180 [Lutibaculum baratangense AMV1]